MTRRLPSLSGQRLIKVLERADFRVLRQRGSHVSLEKSGSDATYRTVVPLHKELSRGTLSDILRQCGLSKDDLRDLL